MTARAIYARLVATGFALAVEDGELVIQPDPPPDLDLALRLLHTGVRSIVTGKAWWGSTGADSDGRPLVEELNPAAPVPAWVGLLTVAGDADGQWDRVRAFWRTRNPEFFQPEKPTQRKTRATTDAPTPER